MRKMSVGIWLALLVVALLALTGCAPRSGAGETATASADSGLAIDLPAIVIDIDDAGNASLSGIPLAQLGSSLGAPQLAGLTVPADQVKMLTDANIQHIQVNSTPKSLQLIVNGQPIPSLDWGDGDQNGLLEVLSLLGVQQAAIEQFLPMIKQLGFGLTLRFPLGQGSEAIPLIVEGSNAAQSEFLSSVGGKPPVINIPVLLKEDGSFTVAGLTNTELANLSGQAALGEGIGAQTVLDLKAKGVKEITLSTDANGLHIERDGSALVNINWANGALAHGIAVAGQLGLLDSLAGEDGNAEQITALINELLPAITSSDFHVRLLFPQ